MLKLCIACIDEGNEMRYRSEEQKQASIENLLEQEAVEHDLHYKDKFGFGSPTLELDKSYVWQVNDKIYKRGVYKRGHVKRLMFELLDLDNISGKKVLDVGCGNGQHGVFMAMHGAEVYGFDLSEVGIEVANAMAKANEVDHLCHFRVANISELPYEDNQFDVILLNAVLHHILKYPNVREETYRVLKPGGKVVMRDGLRENPLYRGARALRNYVKGLKPDLGDVDLERKDLLAFCEGFENVELKQRCLLEGIKNAIAPAYNIGPVPRGVLFLAKCTDDVVLTLLPGMQKYCSELLGSMTKPLKP
jgi:2-polyprenyl-3-methyl-5-hydroxy-6-metoxy-1,4-benzoquinol methylase